MHTRATATAVAVAAAALTATAPAVGAASTPAERLAAKQEYNQTKRAMQVRQHDSANNHLPAARENMEVVSKLELTAPFGNVLEGQVADVAVHKNAAYLMSWSPFDSPTDTECKRGGFWSVDISDPAAPKQVAFEPALKASYHGEGAQAITLRTPAFSGDVLAVNNEPCSATGDAPGGFDLYDVSNPADPKPLVQGAGDRSPEGSLVQDPTEEFANSSHSIFIWQDGPRAYASIVDNEEAHDVDIFDITDPRAPVQIGDFDLVELFPEIVQNSANGNSVFLHDMVVKEIDGVQTMLASYWDAGYVQLDVEDPANPKRITDTAFDDVEPLFDIEHPSNKRPEGNAHYAEFSADNRFLLAADEDFATYRPRFSITTGPNAGEYESGEFGFSTPVVTLDDRKLNGPTVYGGLGCRAQNPSGGGGQVPNAETALPTVDAGEERILLVLRGTCRFDEKMTVAIERGYDGIVVGQSHQGSAALDGPFCGGGNPRDIVAVCVGHGTLHRILNDEPEYSPGGSSADLPAPGTTGEEVSAESFFDGWGYAHLYDAKTSAKLDDYAIQEAGDERFASNFGDLSIHEWATDPQTNLAYAAYYSGGLRTVRFTREGGIEEVGKFIDRDGSNFWGVEQFSAADGSRLIAGSDRDFGLYIMRYTGPGAVGPRPVQAATPATPATPARPTAVALKPSFFSFGGEKTLTLRGRRVRADVTVPGAGAIVGRLKVRIGRTVRTLGTARRTATRRGMYRLTFRLSARNATLLRRTIARRSTRRTSGVLRVTFSPVGGNKRTRNRAVSLRVGR